MEHFKKHIFTKAIVYVPFLQNTRFNLLKCIITIFIAVPKQRAGHLGLI